MISSIIPELQVVILSAELCSKAWRTTNQRMLLPEPAT
jgi:hypothetical protein